MEIVFLGTGGGRINMVSQKRRTGGFRINGPLQIHVDPGPGALLSSHDFCQDPSSLDGLIITHNHIDHTSDAGALMEAMVVGKWLADGKTKNGRPDSKAGFIAGSKSAIEGDRDGDRGIPFYHLSKAERVETAKVGTPIIFGSGKKTAALLPTPVRHDDKTGFGFVLEMGGKRIGYTSDTEYFGGIAAHYQNCDILIINNLKSGKDGIPGHLDSLSTAKLLSETRPKLAVITHLGTKLIDSGPEKDAEKIEKSSGIRTVAAKDGMKMQV